MSEDILVSVICNAYNQEKYIRDALDSFIMQKTNFKFEILVHDDASTDGTREIIEEYARKYPDLIKPILQTENQYSKGVKISQLYQYSRVQGKYIAFCEGDDYWTDETKLQKQVDALEQHPEIDICAHAAIQVEANTKKIMGYIQPTNKTTIFPIRKVILGGGGFVATNSLMYRATLNDLIPSYRQYMTIDYCLQMQGSLRGGMLYLEDCMSAYRYMADGSWSKAQVENKNKRKVHLSRVAQMFCLFDQETQYRYTKIVHQTMMKNLINDALTAQNYQAILSKENREIFISLPIKDQIKIFIKANFPILIKIRRALKR